MHVALVDIHIRIREMAFEALEKMPVAAFVAKKIEQSGLALTDVAAKCGWQSAAALQLIIDGRTKLPVNMVRPLAEALGVSPANLLRLVMQEYMPETYKAIVDVLDLESLSQFENEALEAIRLVSRNGEHSLCISRSERLVIVEAPSQGHFDCRIGQRLTGT
jgi:hypothetical protein